MLSITPVRARISERFPVASFVVTVPPDRYFEVACTTGSRLFRAENRHARRATNFATIQESDQLAPDRPKCAGRRQNEQVIGSA